MTKKELQAQINFLVSELKRLRNGYNKLSDEAFNDKINKNKFYGMWRKADEKADLKRWRNDRRYITSN